MLGVGVACEFNAENWCFMLGGGAPGVAKDEGEGGGRVDVGREGGDLVMYYLFVESGVDC